MRTSIQVGVAGALALSALCAHPVALVGNIFVDDSNTTAPFDGTSTNPYTTITAAINAGLSSGDVVHIASGNYTAALGEDYPLDALPDGVTLEGPSGPSSGYPRLGGDLIDDGEITGIEASAIVHIDCRTTSRSGITLRRLKFIGENETSIDSPIAVLIEVDGDENAQYSLSNTEITGSVFERPYQNNLGASGRATIHINVQNGSLENCELSENQIEVSNRGGVEILALAEENLSATTDIDIVGNYITNTGNVSAAFGFRWHGLDGGAPEPGTFFMKGFSKFNSNVISGRGAALVAGVQILCEERSDFLHTDTFAANIIEGCAGNGLELMANGWAPLEVHPEIAVFGFSRNMITNNGGSGIVLEWDPDGAEAGGGYLHLIGSNNNVIADNGEYGVSWIGFGDDSAGSFDFNNDTIVNNTLAACGFDVVDESDVILPYHVNCIVYGNGGDVQTDGLGTTKRDELLANVTYCDWQGITSGTGNISVNPNFVNVSIGDYHLDNDPPSLCVDGGDNAVLPSGYIVDIDREDRTQDGICPISGTPIVDMGCDELTEASCSP